MRSNQDYSGKSEELVPGSMYGFRWWKVSSEGRLTSINKYPLGNGLWWKVSSDGRLTSIHKYPLGNGYKCWDSTEIAQCMMDSTSHLAPDHNCVCGIYARYFPTDMEDLNGSVYSHTKYYLTGTPIDTMFVNGIIAASGKIELGSRGFRAERAKILALSPGYLSSGESKHIEIIANAYNARFFENFADLVHTYPVQNNEDLIFGNRYQVQDDEDPTFEDKYNNDNHDHLLYYRKYLEYKRYCGNYPTDNISTTEQWRYKFAELLYNQGTRYWQLPNNIIPGA